MFKVLKRSKQLKFILKYYSTAQSDVLSFKEDEILFIGLNRPSHRNCINSNMSQFLIKAFQDFEQDDSIKVCILFGKGGNFCSGYDFKEILDFQDSSPFDKPMMGPTQMYISKPTIAAIDGYAVAGGLELALFCDLRICDKDSVFGALSTRFNLPMIDSGTVRLPKIVGLSKALELTMTGRKVFSTEALSIGLVNEVVTVGASLGRAVALARSIIKYNQESVIQNKKSIYYSTFEAKTFEEGCIYELNNGAPIVNKNLKEAAKKFVEQKIGRHGKTKIHSLEELMEKYKPELI